MTAYEDDLLQIEPYLRQLSRVSRVIWLIQDPVRDFAEPLTTDNTDVYNQVARRVLK